MGWEVRFHPEFEDEFANLEKGVFGSRLGRPLVDTLKGASNPNLKELRFRSGKGAWRFVFAFDPKRQAIVLCGGDKSGIGSDRFYNRLIRRADERFTRYLKRFGG